MKTFTKEELAVNNGKNGTPVLIAYCGKIYDMSKSFLWKNGNHQAFHKAGKDLTEDLARAPHGEDRIKRYPVVGILPEGDDG